MSLLLQDKLVLSPETAKKLQQEIDDLAGATDCADVVGTKADLDSYDTSGLTDQAIIKVLQDESQNDAQTYYRYNKASDSFILIGELGPYYTKSEDDALLAEKLDKTDTASQVYGTDIQGNQTTYNKDDFGKVDDVQVNGTSIVSNKIASFVVDNALDNSSANPVENQVVTSAISQKSGVVFRNWNA